MFELLQITIYIFLFLFYFNLGIETNKMKRNAVCMLVISSYVNLVKPYSVNVLPKLLPRTNRIRYVCTEVCRLPGWELIV